MARPKGSKTDPIGTIFVRVEKDIQYIAERLKKAKTAFSKAKAEARYLKRMGL
jgi:hypothetical protein